MQVTPTAPVAGEGQEAAPADTIGVIEGPERTIDRFGEVRSLEDLWTLLGDFQAELIGFGLKLVLALVVFVAFVVIFRTVVVNNEIVNHTMQAAIRLDVPFGIACKEDIDRAREVVMATIEGDDRLRESPEPRVVVTRMADSSGENQEPA